MHKAGFVNIIGKPNAGKSTLLNSLIGDRAAIITHKPQTTRHRLKALINGNDFQIIFSDTPGFIDDPSYKMQESMNKFVRTALDDADLLLFLISPDDTDPEENALLTELLKVETQGKVYLILNKVDLLRKEEAEKIIASWTNAYLFDKTFYTSALNDNGTRTLLEEIHAVLPVHPPYYSKEEWTDRSERFFVSELIREQILLLYHQEIPYSVEVVVESFKRGKSKNGDIIRMGVTIYVSRDTQKYIMIGSNGSMIKKLGTRSRATIEEFFGEKVFLELFIKAKKDWRDSDQMLKSFGYE